MRPVIVRYTRSPRGWSYDVLAADELRWLGGGWSAGKRKDAVDAFRSAAQRNGWEEREMRAQRMKGAA